MKIENTQDFISSHLSHSIKEIAISIGLIYLDSNEYSWNFGDDKVVKMTDMSLRQLKDSRKQIIKDIGELTDSCIDIPKIMEAVCKGNDHGELEFNENETIEVKTHIVNEVKKLLHEKEKDLNLEISMRP